MTAHEVNFDGIVGPTHNYAGLSYGNVASMRHKARVSNPRAAALEGLAKMKCLADLGVKQAVLPPHERPHIPTLKRLGFTGTDAQILEKAHRDDPAILAAVSSASAMWAANAATVSPSADCADGRVHFTPANLVTNFHRSIESPTTTRVFCTIFADDAHFAVHDPLSATPRFADEGAANHMRLSASQGVPGLEVFVYGSRASDVKSKRPSKYPARQMYEACAAIARNHLLDPRRVLFLRQNPKAIDAGAFHNDVVAVANENLLLYQKDAFTDCGWTRTLGNVIVAKSVTLADARTSYLFNSQLVTLPDGSMALIAPSESKHIRSVREFISRLKKTGVLKAAHYVNVRQSMHNGGGPACLRLRVVLTNQEARALNGNVFFTSSLHASLKRWIEKHYRDELSPNDLRDPSLLEESRNALDELTRILRLGSIYEFQQ